MSHCTVQNIVIHWVMCACGDVNIIERVKHNSTMYSVPAVCHRVNNYELLCDTIFWTNFHLTKEVKIAYKRLFIVDVNVST